MKNILEINNAQKSYAEDIIVNDLTFSLKEGEIGCLLGPSGCGKTTILRAIAGFTHISAGSIKIGDKIVSSQQHTASPEKRQIGMVFQDYALFPHLTVNQNIAFGLFDQKKSDQQKRVTELLDLVGLQDVASKYPHEISGGQQQRVALARALAPRPALLLMDEPFSNLDVTLRERLSLEVREIIKTYGISAIMVTHNQNEAFAMGDKIGVIDKGNLLQWDTAHNLYHKPVDQIVADFVGEGVLIPGKVIGKRTVETELGLLVGDFHYPCTDGCKAHVLIRPEDVVHDDASEFKAKIIKKNFRGANILYTLQLETGEQIFSLAPSHHNHNLNQEIGIIPDVEDIILFEVEKAKDGPLASCMI